MLLDKYIIYSYRIERAMRISKLKNISRKNEKFIFEGIICAIDIHRQAMKLVCKNYTYYYINYMIIFICI